MADRLSNSRTSTSSLSESRSYSDDDATFSLGEKKSKKPIMKVVKQNDDKKEFSPKKTKKPVNTTSTEPKFEGTKNTKANQETLEKREKNQAKNADKPKRSTLSKLTSTSHELDPLGSTANEKKKPGKKQHDKTSKSNTKLSKSDSRIKGEKKGVTSLGKVASAVPNYVGQAIRAIEDGNFVEFQRLVPRRVPVDSISSQGRSLLAIAKFHQQQNIVSYINQQLTGRVIKAIEEGNLTEVEKFVHSQVPSGATSSQGYTLLEIANRHHQKVIAGYLIHELNEGFGSSIGAPTSSSAITGTAQGKPVTIEFYHSYNPYYEFTNFYKGRPIVIDGIPWKTTEHYFQAQKFVSSSQIQAAIQAAAIPGEAFQLARANGKHKRADWEVVKDDVMRKVLRAKFTQDDRLKQLLLSTGNAELVEASDKDSYWGNAPDENGNEGQNKLGKLLMELRTELA
jgi:N-glycosidase YbiA